MADTFQDKSSIKKSLDENLINNEISWVQSGSD